MLKVNVHLSGNRLDEKEYTIHDNDATSESIIGIFRRASGILKKPIMPVGIRKMFVIKNSVARFVGEYTLFVIKRPLKIPTLALISLALCKYAVKRTRNMIMAKTACCLSLLINA